MMDPQTKAIVAETAMNLAAARSAITRILARAIVTKGDEREALLKLALSISQVVNPIRTPRP